MVVIETLVDNKDKPLYMDGGLHEQLINKVQPSVQKKDSDWVMVIDGEERSGKSVFAFQIAKVLDPNFSHEQVAFTANDFIKLVIKAKKHQCIVFDEAFTGLSSRTSLSEINNLLVSLMMEMGQKNLYIILVMPSFFMLDKYCVLHRARGLFHIYTREGKRGFWEFYNKKRMKMLYFKGKKFYDYSQVKPIIFGRFQDQYMVLENEYREIKKKALHKKQRHTRAEAYKLQRDLLLFGLYNDYLKKNKSALARFSSKWNLGIKRRMISEIIIERERDLIESLERLEEEKELPDGDT